LFIQSPRQQFRPQKVEVQEAKLILRFTACVEGRHSGLTGRALLEWKEKRRSQNQEGKANKPGLKLKYKIYYS